MLTFPAGDPFYSSFELPSETVVSSVTVTAINCNGQRVKVCNVSIMKPDYFFV